MEILLLGIYSFFVWLIFIKLKLLPWTTQWKVAVAIFPVVAIACLMLLLNIFAPTSRSIAESTSSGSSPFCTSRRRRSRDERA